MQTTAAQITIDAPSVSQKMQVTWRKKHYAYMHPEIKIPSKTNCLFTKSPQLSRVKLPIPWRKIPIALKYMHDFLYTDKI